MKVEVISYYQGWIDAFENLGERIIDCKNQVYTKTELLKMLDKRIETAKITQDKYIKLKALKQQFGK